MTFCLDRTTATFFCSSLRSSCCATAARPLRSANRVRPQVGVAAGGGAVGVAAAGGAAVARRGDRARPPRRRRAPPEPVLGVRAATRRCDGISIPPFLRCLYHTSIMSNACNLVLPLIRIGMDVLHLRYSVAIAAEAPAPRRLLVSLLFVVLLFRFRGFCSAGVSSHPQPPDAG